MSNNNIKSKLMRCDMCGAITVPSLYLVCQDCADEDERLFQIAKNSIKFNENVTAEQVFERTGIDVKNIRRWVRIGRFGKVD